MFHTEFHALLLSPTNPFFLQILDVLLDGPDGPVILNYADKPSDKTISEMDEVFHSPGGFTLEKIKECIVKAELKFRAASKWHGGINNNHSKLSCASPSSTREFVLTRDEFASLLQRSGSMRGTQEHLHHPLVVGATHGQVERCDHGILCARGVIGTITHVLIHSYKT